MSGRTPREALDHHARLVQHALSLLTPAVVRPSFSPRPSTSAAIILNNFRPVPLPRGAIRSGLRLAQRVDVQLQADATYATRVLRYAYVLMELPGKQEIAAFHLYPDVKDHALPHLHLGPAMRVAPACARLHIPTGVVTVANVVEVATAELGIVPRAATGGLCWSVCGRN